jgi:hypothetical protein
MITKWRNTSRTATSTKLPQCWRTHRSCPASLALHAEVAALQPAQMEQPAVVNAAAEAAQVKRRRSAGSFANDPRGGYCRLFKGKAAGPSGITCARVILDAHFCPIANSGLRRLLNVMLAGTLPYINAALQLPDP